MVPIFGKFFKKTLPTRHFPSYMAFIVIEQQGRPECVGSGFLVDKREGLVVTAMHVAYEANRKFLESYIPCTTRVFLAGKHYEADIVWPAPIKMNDCFVADIASLKLRLNENNDRLPEAAKLCGDLVWIDRARNHHFFACGYPERTVSAPGMLHAHYIRDATINVPMDHVAESTPCDFVRANASYASMSLGNAVDILRREIEIKRGRLVEADDIARRYERFVVFYVKNGSGIHTEYGGYMGGVVVNAQGIVLGLLRMGMSHELLATPATDILNVLPKEARPHTISSVEAFV